MTPPPVRAQRPSRIRQLICSCQYMKTLQRNCELPNRAGILKSACRGRELTDISPAPDRSQLPNLLLRQSLSDPSYSKNRLTALQPAYFVISFSVLADTFQCGVPEFRYGIAFQNHHDVLREEQESDFAEPFSRSTVLPLLTWTSASDGPMLTWLILRIMFEIQMKGRK